MQMKFKSYLLKVKKHTHELYVILAIQLLSYKQIPRSTVHLGSIFFHTGLFYTKQPEVFLYKISGTNTM